MSALQFDPSTHSYTLDGARVISVTQLIESCGLVDGLEWMTEEARERGSAVHEAIHRRQQGDLGFFLIDEAIEPYVDAYERFLCETGFDTYLSETALASRRHRYAGTIDRLGWLGGELTLIDWKTGAYAPHMDLQLELYALLLEENREDLALDGPPARRMIVELRGDGRYQVRQPQTSPRVINSMVNAMLTINLFREGKLR